MLKKIPATHFLLATMVATLPFVSGCSSLKFPGVYRIPIQQGNIIEQEKVDQLELGMSKTQVQFVMGTPLLADVFHQDRWDYIYQLRRGDKTLRERRFTVFFDDDKLVKFEGDYEPNAEAPVDDNYIEDAKKTQGE